MTDTKSPDSVFLWWLIGMFLFSIVLLLDCVRWGQTGRRWGRSSALVRRGSSAGPSASNADGAVE